MLKKLLLCLLLTSVNCQAATALLISGSIEARRSQIFSVPTANSWQVQIKWMADEGATVAAGDPVVVYETASLATEVEQKEASLRKAEAEAKQSKLKLELGLKEALFRQQKAELELEKAKLDAAVPEAQRSKLDYAKFQLTLNKAENELESATEALAAKQQEVDNELAKIRINVAGAVNELKRTQLMLNSMTQRANAEGTVQYVDHPWHGTKIRPGDTVQRGFTVLQIPSTDDLMVRGWLNEVDVAKVTVGQSINLEVDAIPGLTLTGQIEKISNQAESRDSWGEAAYFALDITFSSEKTANLVPGMSVVGEVKQ